MLSKKRWGKYCSGSCRRIYLNKTNNPAWSPEAKEKISKNHADVSGSNNHFYGKKGVLSSNYIDGRSNFQGRTSRKIALANGILRKCSVCGEDNIKKLELHHKDGNHYNNDLSNMVFLCRNCHLTIAHEYIRNELGKFAYSIVHEIYSKEAY